jgi:uncharacterized membrane protein (GlpM family)
MNKKTVITIGGLLLCVLFFTAPLVQCSQRSSLSATGLEIAAGTGQLMSEADKSYPIVFVLLIMPIILVIAAFANKSFATLRNISIAGLAAEIIFMIAAYAMLNSDDYDGAFVLTAFNWLIAAIYIGLIGLAQYCNKPEATVNIVEVPTNEIGNRFKVKLLTNAEGLGIREKPNASKEPFTRLPNGTEVELLEIGSAATLNNIKGSWYKIKTDDEIQGWCFSGSLEKIKTIIDME